MKNFQNRAAYFELENMLDENMGFLDKIKTVKIISKWASNQMGYDPYEAEAYTRSHIANIVRENEVAKMLKRIQNDLFDNNIDTTSEIMLEKSKNLFQTLADILKDSHNASDSDMI